MESSPVSPPLPSVPEKASYWQGPATRRELVFLGFTLLIVAWVLSGHREQRVIVVPGTTSSLSALT
jgi:hypothetical protein